MEPNTNINYNSANINTSPFTRLSKYKWIIIPVALVIVLGFILLLVQKTTEYPKTNINRNNNEAQKNVQKETVNTIGSRNIQKIGDSEYSIDPNNLQGVTKKETLADGTVKYYLQSTDTTQYDFILAKGSDFLFRRAVFSKNYELPLSSFINLYGTADRIITGSKVYGSTTEKYIYSSLGFTLFVNSKSKMVIEQHVYPSMTIDTYISKYGGENY